MSLRWSNGSVPWCPECDRFLSPATVTPAGGCPRCGFPVEPGRARVPEPDAADAADEGDDGGGDDGGHGDDGDGLPPVPWHLKLMVGALAVYLGWRAFQGIEWAVRQL